MNKLLTIISLIIASALLQGCLAVAATGVVVGTAGAVVGTGVKVGGAVVGAAIPNGEAKKKDKKDKKGG
jgi:hypothetical protein